MEKWKCALQPIRGVLINVMCIFGVSVRKANAEISAEQDGCTRMRGVLLRSCHAGEVA